MPSRRNDLAAGGRSRSTGARCSSSAMYCQMSSSVQLRQREDPDVLALAGGGRCRGSTARAAGSSGPTGRTRRGSENTRSLARAFSSSRRAPPKTASKRFSSMRVEQRGGLQPVAAGPRAGLLDRPGRRRSSSCTEADDEPDAELARPPRSRNSMTSGKLWPVSTCITGNGMRAGQNAFVGEVQHDDRVLAAGEQQHRALELGGDLADDVDRLGLERPQVGELVVHQGDQRRVRAAPGEMLTQIGRQSLPSQDDTAQPDRRPTAAADRRRPRAGRATVATRGRRAARRAPRRARGRAAPTPTTAQGRGRPPGPRAASWPRLAERLAAGDAVLSEEGATTPRRLDAERVWIVDPLDGTREFGEPPPDRLGRARRPRRSAARPVAGAVALPGARAHARAPIPPPPPPPPHDRAAPGDRQPHPPAGRGHVRWPTRSAASSSRWARPAPRPWPSCAARPTSTPTPAASTSGTRARRSRSPLAAGLHARGSTARPLVYNRRRPLPARPADLPARAGRARRSTRWPRLRGLSRDLTPWT